MLVISRLKDYAKVCQAFGQQVSTSIAVTAGTGQSIRQHNLKSRLVGAQNSGMESANTSLNNGGQGLFAFISCMGRKESITS